QRLAYQHPAAAAAMLAALDAGATQAVADAVAGAVIGNTAAGAGGIAAAINAIPGVGNAAGPTLTAAAAPGFGAPLPVSISYRQLAGLDVASMNRLEMQSISFEAIGAAVQTYAADFAANPPTMGYLSPKQFGACDAAALNALIGAFVNVGAF